MCDDCYRKCVLLLIWSLSPTVSVFSRFCLASLSNSDFSSLEKKIFYVDHKAVCDLLARQLQSQAQTSNRLFAARSDSIRGFYLFVQAIYLPRAYKKAAHLSVILIIGTARRSRKLAAWDNLIGVVQKSRRATTSQRVLIQLNKILSRHINLGFNGTVNFTVERDLN